MSGSQSALQDKLSRMTLVQRLLRGRAFYISLGLFIVFLYGRAAPIGHLAPHLSLETSSQEETLEWWPKELDAAAVSRISQEQPGLALTFSLLSSFVFGMCLGGVGLTVWALSSGRIRSVWRFASHPLPHWSFGELGRIVALTLMILSLLPFAHLALNARFGEEIDARLWLPLSMLFLDVFVILTIVEFAAGKRQALWKNLGVLAHEPWKTLEIAFRGYIGLFPWLFVALFLSVEAMRFLGMRPPTEPIQELLFLEQRPSVLALTTLLACFIAPVAEELFFRGVVYTAIRRRLSRVWAMLISASVFALIHANPAGFLSILVLGCLLADLYERSGSLLAPLAVHVVHNTFLMSLALIFRHLLSAVGT